MNISRIKKSFQIQQGQSDCGIACLASILKYHGSYEYNHKLRILSGTSKEGTSLLGLYQAAVSLGFNADGYKANQIDDLHKLKNPVILHLIIDNGIQHFVVFYGFKEDYVIIGDPRYGIQRWSRSQLDESWKSKTFLDLEPDMPFKKKNDPSVYDTVFNFIKSDLSILFSALFLGLIISVFSLSTAIFSQKLIDNILPDKKFIILIFSLILLGIILITQGLISYIRSLLLLIQSKLFNIRLIDKFFKLILNLPLSFFYSTRTGEMISRMNDTKKIQVTISNIIGNSLIDVLVIMASVTAIFFYSHIVGFVFLFFIPFYLLILNNINRSILSLQHLTMGAYAINESNYIDTITGIEAIKSNQAGPYFNKQAKHYHSTYQDNLFELGKLQIRFRFITNSLNVILFLSLIGLSSYFVMTNKLLVGSLVAILSLSNYIIPALANLSTSYIQFQEARVAFIRMNEFTAIETESSSGHRSVPESFVELTLEDIGFNYPGSTDLLKDINLSLSIGKIKVLSGKNGTGKSTIVHMITRSLTPSAGKISLNGIDINQFPMDEYRRLIGVVPQEIKIFNNTLLFNLTLTDDREINEKAYDWCIQNGFQSFFKNFPSGYHTLLGEDGLKLSGGQKQVLALARTLLKDPRFLILDEITSSLDSDTERFIIDLLLEWKKDAGILIISHDQQIFSIADDFYEISGWTINKEI